MSADQPAAEDATPTPGGRKFGTFGGVFTPTLLTILGVIMYLREGWVVGNAGLAGGALIIVLSFGITALTGLSMSAVVTNIRIGAGGAYSIISRSLGLEVGGSVGIPLYVSQALAVTMYIFGFRAGWVSIFPEHSALLVDFAVFAALFILAYLSASLAVRVQYVIMVLIVGSLVSVAVAAIGGTMTEPITWWGSFRGSPETGFTGIGCWGVFAVFFPAATGIMAGANMSGDLEDPRRSIPVGTLSAIGVSLVVYLLMAWWLARSATPEEPTSNSTILVDLAAWGPAVLAGLMGATFSSALASIVGAPRILQALGGHRILPGGAWFAERTDAGEPRNAMMVTGVLVLGALLLRDLNAVAPLITMFFLITYAMINVVVLIEQRLRLASFRPLLKVPQWVPFLGALGCFGSMFIINPPVSVAAVVVVIVFYAVLLRRHLEAPFGDVRSGLFVALAEWAAKKVRLLRGPQTRAWKPNFLVPVLDSSALKGIYRFLESMALPKGSVALVGVTAERSREEIMPGISRLAHSFREDGVYASWTVLDEDRFEEGVANSMQSLSAAFFQPNILFLHAPRDPERHPAVRELLEVAGREGLGAALLARHPDAGLGRRKRINLWIPEPREKWEDFDEVGVSDLSVLLAFKLYKNWDGEIRLLMVPDDPDDVDRAASYLNRVADLARLPDASVRVLEGWSEGWEDRIPSSDISIHTLTPGTDLQRVVRMPERAGASCLFVQDSGRENAFA